MQKFQLQKNKEQRWYCTTQSNSSTYFTRFRDPPIIFYPKYWICIQYLFTHLIKFSQKLNFSSVLNKIFHSTESNAFSKLQNDNFCWSFQISQYSKISSIVLALKPINLPLIYAVWSSCIKLLITFWSLRANTNAKIL